MSSAYPSLQPAPIQPSNDDQIGLNGRLLQGLVKKPKHSKVRSGCVTCKRRHIKCDERKPTCERCANSGIRCDGYQLPRTWLFETVASLNPGPVQENELLQHFVTEGAVLLSGYAYSARSFWDAFSPQLSESYPAVRHSLLAFASRVQSAVYRWDTNKPREKAMSYRSLALVHYNQAIRHLTQPQETVLPPEVLVTCCLIFTGMELWPHRDMSPTVHLAAAFRLMQRTPMSTLSLEIQQGLMPLLNHFSRNALAFADDVPPDLFNIMFEYAWVYYPRKHIPDKFENRKQALEQLEALLKYILAFIFCSTQTLAMRSDLTEFSGQMLRAVQQGAQALSPSRSIQEAYCQKIYRFYLMHHRVLQIMLDTSYVDDEMVYDSYTADFEYILHECETFLIEEKRPSPNNEDPFEPTLGVLAPLFFVATRCRIGSVRRKAIVALHDSMRRERTWNSCIAAMLARFVLQIEEYGVEDDLVPVENRIRLSTVAFNQDAQEINIDYKQAPFDENSPFEHGKVSWNTGGAIDHDFECYQISEKVLRGSGYSGILLVTPPIRCQCGDANYLLST